MVSHWQLSVLCRTVISWYLVIIAVIPGHNIQQIVSDNRIIDNSINNINNIHQNHKQRILHTLHNLRYNVNKSIPQFQSHHKIDFTITRKLSVIYPVKLLVKIQKFPIAITFSRVRLMKEAHKRDIIVAVEGSCVSSGAQVWDLVYPATTASQFSIIQNCTSSL